LTYDILAPKTPIPDRDLGRAVRTRDKLPFDQSSADIRIPLDQDASVPIDLLDVDIRRGVVHFPIPADALARCEFAAALGEPKLRGDRRVDHRVKNLIVRAARPPL
jgi:hypothetical protein